MQSSALPGSVAMLRSDVPCRLLLPFAAVLAATTAPHGVMAAEVCRFLAPIGGDAADPIVKKRVERPKVGPVSMLLGRTNWNTDFAVDQSYRRYKLFFTADSTDPQAKYPVEGNMKFSDGSSLKLFEETISPPMGTGKMYGPYSAVPGKRTSQINFKIGASRDPEATGFSYRISVQGCN
jgi:hypothetical protein